MAVQTSIHPALARASIPEWNQTLSTNVNGRDWLDHRARRKPWRAERNSRPKTRANPAGGRGRASQGTKLFRSRLLRLDIGLACDLAPLLELGLDQGRERLRAGTLRLRPVLGELLFHLLG